MSAPQHPPEQRRADDRDQYGYGQMRVHGSAACSQVCAGVVEIVSVDEALARGLVMLLTSLSVPATFCGAAQ